MNDRSILNICLRANDNSVRIAANDDVVPKIRFRTDLDVANDDDIFGDPCGWINLGRFSLIRSKDHKMAFKTTLQKRSRKYLSDLLPGVAFSIDFIYFSNL